MPPTITQSLSALLSAFPSADSSDPESTACAYMMAIEDIPEQFVAQAVRRFIRGEVKRDRHTFLPAAPELAREARNCRDEERGRQYLALPKPEPQERRVSDEERAKVDEMMAKLAADLAARASPAPRARPPDQSPGELAPLDLSGVTLSPLAIERVALGAA